MSGVKVSKALRIGAAGEQPVTARPDPVTGGIELLGPNGGGINTYVHASEPLNPEPGQIWVSNKLLDANVSHQLRDRTVLFTPTAEEGQQIQEVNAFTNATHYVALYTAGNGLCLRTCPLESDPMVPANWTKFQGQGGAKEVIGGGGAAGLAGTVNHGQVFIDGDTLWYYGNVHASLEYRIWTAQKDTPQTWTYVGVCFTSAQQASLSSSLWGNCDVVKDGGTYYMLIEYFHTVTSKFQMVWATASSPSGPWTLSSTTPITSLYIGTGTFRFNGASGPKLIKEGSDWLLFYHSDNWWGLSAIFRAKTGSLGLDNFTVIDQPSNNGYAIEPWIHPVSTYEIEQCADIEILRGPFQDYAIWTAVDNRSPSVFRIMAAPLIPAIKRWDGYNWHKLNHVPSRDRGIAAATKPVSVRRTSDFAGTSTTYATFISQVHAPAGTEVDVELAAVVTASQTGLYKFRALVSEPSTITGPMGGVHLTAGEQTVIHLRARLARVNPGRATTYYVQYIVPAGATLNCRPATQADTEVATMILTDVAYRPI